MCPLSRSPGYGLTLVSESTTGVTHASERSSHSSPASSSCVGTEGSASPVLPEDIGCEAASQLLQEIVHVSVHKT